jgi:hypothetical protein
MGLDFRLPWKPFGHLRRSLLRRPLTGGTPARLSAPTALLATMANPVKAWRTVDAGSAQPLHQVVQPSLVLPLAQSAAHRDEALALVSADALVRRLCDRPNAVREGVARENPAPVAGSARAPLWGPFLLPAERILGRHATPLCAKKQVLRLSKPHVPGSRSLKRPGEIEEHRRQTKRRWTECWTRHGSCHVREEIRRGLRAFC